MKWVENQPPPANSPNSKSTQKSDFCFVELTFSCCPESSRNKMQARFPDAQSQCGWLSSATLFKHKIKNVITLFPLQSPSKYFNRNGESGVLTQKTCEHTYRLLSFDFWCLRLNSSREHRGWSWFRLHCRLLRASKHTLRSKSPPPRQQRVELWL